MQPKITRRDLVLYAVVMVIAIAWWLLESWLGYV